MHRKEFLERSLQATFCCGAALFAASASAQSVQEKAANQPVSPCDRRVKQGQDVIRRIMQQLDAKIEPSVRQSIMESCGPACYEGAHGKRNDLKPTAEQAAKFLEGMKKYLGPDGIKQNGDETVVYFKYTGNPQGLKTADGYCLCPILEDAPKGIPATYCQCSAGYVREIFERGGGKPAAVEITETVLRGGKTCRFIVSFKS